MPPFHFSIAVSPRKQDFNQGAGPGGKGNIPTGFQEVGESKKEVQGSGNVKGRIWSGRRRGHPRDLAVF